MDIEQHEEKDTIQKVLSLVARLWWLLLILPWLSIVLEYWGIQFLYKSFLKSKASRIKMFPYEKKVEAASKWIDNIACLMTIGWYPGRLIVVENRVKRRNKPNWMRRERSIDFIAVNSLYFAHGWPFSTWCLWVCLRAPNDQSILAMSVSASCFHR